MKNYGISLGGFGFMLGLCLGTSGCDEAEKPAPPKEETKVAEPSPEPEVKSPPHFVIGEDGASVRSTHVEGGKKSGLIATPELDELKNALAAEKEFIDGKEINVVIDRKAKRGWVGAYFAELGDLGVSKINVMTETRADFPGKLMFSPPNAGTELKDCSQIGQVTKSNGSTLWQLKGGTAKERGPGLGGPDLSMAKEVFAETYEKCESDAFVTDGENDKEWGFIYDMAAAAVTTPKAGISRALLPREPQTAGRPVKF
jgi:hypothetical protein